MIRLFAVLSLSLFASPAWAQSFDCDDAETSIEQLICSDSELAELDEKLAETYRGIREALPVEHRDSATAIQRLWIRTRDARCEDHPDSVAGCLSEAYANWLDLGEAGILHAEVELASGEWHLSPLIDGWRFQYVESDEEPGDVQRRYATELSLYIGGQKHQLARYDDNRIYDSMNFVRNHPDTIGYFLTPSGHLHTGFIEREGSGGGTCGWYDRRLFVFLNRHTEPPKEFHRFVLHYDAQCSRPRGNPRTVSATENGALEFMDPLAGPARDRLTAPQMTRVDSEAGTVDEYIRVDTSTSHFEGEPYEDLVARTIDAIQEIESWANNAELNDCGVMTRATHNYRALRVGELQKSLIDEGRPFGFLQFQHYVFNVMTPEHMEPIGRYKPFIDGTLQYLDGMREYEDWESRLVEAADQYPGRSPGVYTYEVVEWPSNPFVDAGFPTNSCFVGAESIWGPVDLEEWVYLFWARRLADGNLETTEALMRRISALLN